tara:strand:- start:122 stop:316 length:195 start_codon:yes stop_codon:yes gene_type:complete
VKVGDLVRVDYNGIPENGTGFVSIVLEINNSENHPNGFQLVKVLENGTEQWYPLGYIEVINERG